MSKSKIRKPDKAIRMFIEPVSAHNSETGCNELYLVVDGRRIAKRGFSATSLTMTWIPLVEGVQFHDEFPDDGVPVFDAGEVQLIEEPRGAKQ
jgi:hypothetical protein